MVPQLKGLDREGIRYQVADGRRQIAERCGLSEGEVVGHRSPFLETKGEVRLGRGMLLLL